MKTPFDQLTYTALYYLEKAMNKLPIDGPNSSQATRIERQETITELRYQIKESMSRKTEKPKSIIFLSEEV